ncbi:MAG: hypothetical protein COB66_07225 [Coxiella sp. (in: Bacteria)]|nr:MAG: hypothetical protein COB66_07225 [Coxiella sp. (in: g-proteobacteria)]
MVEGSPAAPAITATATQKWLVFVSMCLGIFVLAYTTMATTNAMVAIRLQMDLNSTQLQWTMNAYILAAASFIVLSGLLADRYGGRNTYVVAIVLFIMGALVCALSTSVLPFIIGRVLQGLGAAAMLPETLALMKTAFPKEQQGIVTTGWVCGMGIGMFLGPLLSGALTSTIGWTYVFWIATAVAVASLCLLLIANHKHIPNNTNLRIDYWGVLVFLLGIVPFVFAFVEGNSLGWDSGLIIGLLIWGVVFLCLQPIVEKYVKDTPFIKFSYFKDHDFSMGCIGLFIEGYVLFGIYFFSNLYMQNPILLDYTPLQAGLAIAPMGFALFVASLMVGKITAKIGLEASVYLTMGLLLAGIIWFICLGAHIPYTLLWEPFVLIGFSCGLGTKVFSGLAVSTMQADEVARASSLLSSNLFIGAIFGTSVGTILATTLGKRVFSELIGALHLPTRLPLLEIKNAMVGHPRALKEIMHSVPQHKAAVLHILQASSLQGFHYALIASLAVCVIGVIAAWYLVRRRPTSITPY